MSAIGTMRRDVRRRAAEAILGAAATAEAEVAEPEATRILRGVLLRRLSEVVERSMGGRTGELDEVDMAVVRALCAARGPRPTPAIADSCSVSRGLRSERRWLILVHARLALLEADGAVVQLPTPGNGKTVSWQLIGRAAGGGAG